MLAGNSPFVIEDRNAINGRTNGRGNGRANARRNQDSEEAVKSEVFLNIGVTMQMEHQETGEIEDVFISLPFGLGIDTMNEAEMQGNNKNFHRIVEAKNQLLAHFKVVASQLDPGEEIPFDLPRIEMRMRRRGSQATASAPGENPLLTQMAEIFGNVVV